MKTYICKKTFQLEKFDDDGFSTGDYMDIHAGAMFERSESPFRVVGGKETVRLDGITADEGTWLEIGEETLTEYFEEVLDGTQVV